MPMRMAVSREDDKCLLSLTKVEPGVTRDQTRCHEGQFTARDRIDGLRVQLEQLTQRLGVAVAARCA